MIEHELKTDYLYPSVFITLNTILDAISNSDKRFVVFSEASFGLAYIGKQDRKRLQEVRTVIIKSPFQLASHLNT
jgi:hypothetical protein